MSYFIETSKGKVIFKSNNIEQMKIKHDYWQTSDSEYTYKNGYSEDLSNLTLLYSDWHKIYILKNDYGLFIRISLSCGSPYWAEYKLYDLNI